MACQNRSRNAEVVRRDHKVFHVPLGSETLPWNGRGSVPPARYRRRVVIEPGTCRRFPLMVWGIQDALSTKLKGEYVQCALVLPAQYSTILSHSREIGINGPAQCWFN